MNTSRTKRFYVWWGQLCNRQASDGTKKTGRLANGLITIGLGIAAGVIAMNAISDSAGTGEILAEWGSDFGLAVATMAVVVGRGFASIFRTGYARLAAWLPVLTVVGLYSSVFIGIGNVPISSYALIFAGYAGPITQDLIEALGKAKN